MRFRFRWDVILLLASILSFHFVNNIVWLKSDDFPRGVDSVWHLIEVFKYQLAVKQVLYSDLSVIIKFKNLFNLFCYWPTLNWPPFIYLITSITGFKHLSIFFIRLNINFLFFSILVVSTYLLGKKCFNRRTGLLAAFIISFYPATYAFSRQFEMDFHLTGLSALCLYLLEYTEKFKKNKYAALLGIALGVAMLVKLQVIFFLSGPFLYYLNNSIKCARRANYTQLRNALLTLLIALFISISWWGNKLGDISRDFFNHAFALYPYFSGVVPEVLGNQVIPVFSFDSMKFYFVSLINHVSLPLFTVFVLALYFFVNSRERSRALFLTGLVIPMVIFTFISVKWARYILPLIIPMSLISAWAIDKIMNNFLKRLTLTYVITYCICLYMTTTWMLPYYLLPGIIWPKSWVERPLAEPNRQYQHLSKMEAKGVLHAIETKLGDNQEVKILYSADSVPLILQIYLYFQQHSSIYRLNMRRDDDLKIRDDDFILIKKNEWINNSSSYNKYRVLAEINKHAIYVKK